MCLIAQSVIQITCAIFHRVDLYNVKCLKKNLLCSIIFAFTLIMYSVTNYNCLSWFMNMIIGKMPPKELKYCYSKPSLEIILVYCELSWKARDRMIITIAVVNYSSMLQYLIKGALNTCLYYIFSYDYILYVYFAFREHRLLQPQWHWSILLWNWVNALATPNRRRVKRGR